MCSILSNCYKINNNLISIINEYLLTFYSKNKIIDQLNKCFSKSYYRFCLSDLGRGNIRYFYFG